MKRVKIMLLSLALFAVVGAALAFKAKFNAFYCTAATVNGACPVYCPGFVKSSITSDEQRPFVCTAETTTWLQGTVVKSGCLNDGIATQTVECLPEQQRLTIDNQ